MQEDQIVSAREGERWLSSLIFYVLKHLQGMIAHNWTLAPGKLQVWGQPELQCESSFLKNKTQDTDQSNLCNSTKKLTFKNYSTDISGNRC